VTGEADGGIRLLNEVTMGSFVTLMMTAQSRL